MLNAILLPAGLVFFTSIGLGRLFGLSAPAGRRFAIGYFSIPILLTVVGCAGARFSISCALVFLSSAIGIALLARDARAPRVLSPDVVLLAVYLALYFAFFGRNYVAGSWDEFSHWALMPKQILLWDRLTSNSFLYRRFLDYTPGWPAILAYPESVLRMNFSTGSFLLIHLIAGIAAFWATWEFLVRRTGSALRAWVICLLLMRCYAWTSLLPLNALVEGPLESVMTLSFLLALECALEKESPPVFELGLALASGFLIKKSFVAFIPIAALSWPAIRGNPRRAISVFLPPLFAMIGWKIVSAGYPHVFAGQNIGSGTELIWQLSDASSVSIAKGMWARLFPLLWKEWQLTLVFVLSAATTLWNRRGSFLIWPLVSAAIYLLGLFFLYRFNFPGREGLELAAYDRYILTLIRWMCITSLVIAATFLPRLDFRHVKRVALVSIAFLTLACLEQSIIKLKQHRKYNGTTPELEAGPALTQLLRSRFGGRHARVLLLHAGNNEYTHYQARFGALLDSSSPEFELIGYPGLEIDPPPGTNYRDGLHPISASNFKQLAESADIIWLAELSQGNRARLPQVISIDPVCVNLTNDPFLVQSSIDPSPVHFTCAKAANVRRIDAD